MESMDESIWWWGMYTPYALSLQRFSDLMLGLATCRQRTHIDPDLSRDIEICTDLRCGTLERCAQCKCKSDESRQAAQSRLVASRVRRDFKHPQPSAARPTPHHNIHTRIGGEGAGGGLH